MVKLHLYKGIINTKSITGDKKEYFIIIKCLIHQEENNNSKLLCIFY